MARRAPKLPAGFGAKLKALIAAGHAPREAMKLAWRNVTVPARNAARASGARFCPERVAPPSRFAPGSFRTVKVKGHRVTVGCPKGHFKAGRCQVGTQAQRILHPAGERGACPLPGRELKKNRATPRELLDVGTVNLEASDEVSALVIGAGGLRPSPGLRGEFREVPIRFKRRTGKPLDELAQEIAEAQGRHPKEVQDKILGALKRRARVFGEHERASTKRPPAGVDVPAEDWRLMSDSERRATVELFRAGTPTPGAGGVHRPRVRVQADQFTLGLHSPWKGRVSRVNPPAPERKCRKCGAPTIYTSGVCRWCQEAEKKKNPAAGNPIHTAIVEDIYEGASRYPVVRHVFYGRTAKEARAVRLAHARADKFLAAAIRGTSYRGIQVRASFPAPELGAQTFPYAFANPLTRVETGRVLKRARRDAQLSRRGRPPSLSAGEMQRDPCAAAAHKGFWLGRSDALLGVARDVGVYRRRRRGGRWGTRIGGAGLGPHRILKRNPPRGSVEVYGHVLEIKAQKGRRSRYAGERFVHRFRQGGPIFGLPGGELLIAGAK